MSANKKTFCCEIDGEELACRIAERCCGFVRLGGMTATEALSQLAQVDEQIVVGFRGAAKVAAEYFAECISKAAVVQ